MATMGRNDGRQWGGSMPAYGEVLTATDTTTDRPCRPTLHNPPLEQQSTTNRSFGSSLSDVCV